MIELHAPDFCTKRKMSKIEKSTIQTFRIDFGPLCIKDEFYFDVFPTSNSELSFCIAVLLILASQRIEVLIAEWFDNEELKAWLSQDVTVKRGATPTMVEWAILSWVAGNPFSSLTDPTKY